jgi:hypothetical protein
MMIMKGGSNVSWKKKYLVHWLQWNMDANMSLIYIKDSFSTVVKAVLTAANENAAGPCLHLYNTCNIGFI